MIRWLINHLDWQKSDNQLIIMNDLLVPASLTWGFPAFRLFYIVVNWILLDFTLCIEQSKTSEYMCLGFRKVKSYTFTALLLNQCFFVCFFFPGKNSECIPGCFDIWLQQPPAKFTWSPIQRLFSGQEYYNTRYSAVI